MTHIALLHLPMTYDLKKDDGVKISRADLLYYEQHIMGVLVVYKTQLQSIELTLLKLASFT